MKAKKENWHSRTERAFPQSASKTPRRNRHTKRCSFCNTVSNPTANDNIAIFNKAPSERLRRILPEESKMGEQVDYQRLSQITLPGTVVLIHMHPKSETNPDPKERFTLLSGRVAVFTFNRHGVPQDMVELAAHGQDITIPADTYHTILALEPSKLIEDKNTYYHPKEKKFAVIPALITEDEQFISNTSRVIQKERSSMGFNLNMFLCAIYLGRIFLKTEKFDPEVDYSEYLSTSELEELFLCAIDFPLSAYRQQRSIANIPDDIVPKKVNSTNEDSASQHSTPEQYRRYSTPTYTGESYSASQRLFQQVLPRTHSPTVELAVIPAEPNSDEEDGATQDNPYNFSFFQRLTTFWNTMPASGTCSTPTLQTKV